MSEENSKAYTPFVYPDGLILQWHITERCNLRCTHCYQEDHSKQELSYKELLLIVDQFKALLNRLKQDRSVPTLGHINISGGEPFIRKDFLDLLEVFHRNKDRFSFGILTNGTFIDHAMAVRLRKLGPRFVQVSIEGSESTNDKIRGRGTFERTTSALKHLIQEKVHSVISFTAHRDNYHEFPAVARLGVTLGVSRVWSDRLIPWGRGSDLRHQMLTPEETREFFEIMVKTRDEAQRNFYRTEIAMHRALQFLAGGGRPYHCGAGDTLLTVQSNGDLYPCRRMPIKVGNLLEKPLVELYYENDLFHALRNPNRISEGCNECSFIDKCRGGLKCLSYAVTGDPFQADPGCWRATSRDKEWYDRVEHGS